MPPCLQKIYIGLCFQQAESSLHGRTPFSETRFNIILSATEVGQFISYVHIFRPKSCTGSFNLPIRATCLTRIIVQLVALIIYGMGDLKL
jgi:hypothetical protein